MPTTDGPSIAARLEQLKSRLEMVARQAGRVPPGVLAVSKLHPAEAIRAAYAAGQRDFGENYAQEAIAKIKALEDLVGIRWHFIGRLQGNKIKMLGRRFASVQSVDRTSVATALAKDPGTQDIYLQYNVAREDTKGGVQDFLELQNLFTFIDRTCPALRVRGLMALPPPDEPPRPYFARARQALEQLRQNPGRHPLDQLSMGTSRDYVDAVAEGATLVRVGQEIFGPRPD